jgi:putative hemolysin
VPIWFDGHNGALFQAAGLIHPAVRTALLPRELIAHRGSTLRMRIGGPIPYRRLASFGSDEDLTAYLRRRTELLSARQQRPFRSQVSAVQPRHTPSDPAPVAPATAPDRLEQEVDALPLHNLLVDAGEQAVYVADAPQIPELLREIGRLREITFRAVGEGTGRALDIDSFDQRYRHLFIWHRERREVVGAYRVGVSERLLAAEGISGLYTSTLFRFDRRLFDHMGPALELGRSFIRLEYQRSFSGLLLLWKGVGRLVVDQPEHAVLFGPVSISASYRNASQQLIAAFLKQNAYRHAASRWVRSRTPFRGRTTHGLHRVVPELRDLDEVSAFIADLEVDRKGIPILLRQYLKVGGRLLGFNVDPAFSNVLDVLVMVDLRTTPEKILARYLGIEGAASFLAHHRRRSPTEPGLEQFVRMHS